MRGLTEQERHIAAHMGMTEAEFLRWRKTWRESRSLPAFISDFISTMEFKVGVAAGFVSALILFLIALVVASIAVQV